MYPNIAFIDYESKILESLKWLFEEEPYHLYTFRNTLEAIKIVKEKEFALVVADQYIPEMSGINFLQKVKEFQPNTVCMIMTTLHDIDTVADAMGRNNIYHIIFKPWDSHELKILVKNTVSYYDENSLADKAPKNVTNS